MIAVYYLAGRVLVIVPQDTEAGAALAASGFRFSAQYGGWVRHDTERSREKAAQIVKRFGASNEEATRYK